MVWDGGRLDAERMETMLRRRLHRFECPSSHTLGEYALELLQGDERAAVAGHVPDCPRCNDELRTLRAFMSTEPAMTSGLAEGLRRLVATLLPAPMARAGAALRGAPAASKTYQAEHVLLTLEPSRETGRRQAALFGLVWTETPGAAPIGSGEVRLFGPGGERATEITDLGNFVFEDLPSGTYRVEIELTGEVVVVEEVAVP